MDYLKSNPLVELAIFGNIINGDIIITRTGITIGSLQIITTTNGIIMINESNIGLITFDDNDGLINSIYRLCGRRIEPYFLTVPSINMKIVDDRVIVSNKTSKITIRDGTITLPYYGIPLTITPETVEYDGHVLPIDKTSAQYRIMYHHHRILIVGRPQLLAFASITNKRLGAVTIRFAESERSVPRSLPQEVEINHRIIKPSDPSFSQLVNSMDYLMSQYLH